jgi:hypothetical protein
MSAAASNYHSRVVLNIEFLIQNSIREVRTKRLGADLLLFTLIQLVALASWHCQNIPELSSCSPYVWCGILRIQQTRYEVKYSVVFYKQFKTYWTYFIMLT